MTIHDTGIIVAQCATEVYRRFHGYVDRDDLVSEGWLWIQEHEPTVQAYQEDAEIDPKRALYRLRRDISIAMEIFARGEKAAAAGYSPSDEYYYTEALLDLMLPHVFWDDPDPPSRDDDAPRSANDPAEGNNWEVFYIDVQDAWLNSGLSNDERVALMMRHVQKVKTYSEIGDQLDMTYGQARKVHRQAVQRVLTHLGGRRPILECPWDCTCHRSPLRTRPGVRSRTSGAEQFLG